MEGCTPSTERLLSTYKVDIMLGTLKQANPLLLLDIPPLPALNVMVRSYKSSVIRPINHGKAQLDGYEWVLVGIEYEVWLKW